MAAEAAAAAKEKMVTLISSDFKKFKVEESVARESGLFRNMIEDNFDDIPAFNVKADILAKAIEYCRKHAAAARGGADGGDVDDLKTFDTQFITDNKDTLFELILAANYMDITGLLDLTCQTAADMSMGKTTEEIRKTFNIKSDFTSEEEEEVRRKNQWAFEG